jgi:4-diphosphocytidyl-2-C-methyl-D-erythritol kinase
MKIAFYLCLLVSVSAFAPRSLNSNQLQTQLRGQTALSSSVNESDYDLSLFSPCKINLFLRIIRKRPDGFHDLASLFQTVGFGDMLHLKLEDESAEKDTFECNMRGVPTDKSNLVIRALDLVRNKTGNEDKFFKANLVKQVPAQAGLGGGSGNAAAAMWGANELLGNPATLEQLVEWSGDLGSDITFFLSEGTAYCTGRGEIMTPVAPLPDGTKLCIVKPDIGLSTPEVFRALDYEQLSTEDPEDLLKAFMDKGAIDAGGNAYVNDLEQPAFDCLPQLRELKEELLTVEGFDHVMMSGSGTSIFCIGEPADKDNFMKTFGERDGLNVFSSEFTSRKEGQWFQEGN